MGCTEMIHLLTAKLGISDLLEQSCSVDKASIASDDLSMIRDFRHLLQRCLPIDLARRAYAADEFGIFDLRRGAARAGGARKLGLSPRPPFLVLSATSHDFGDVITRFIDGGAAL